METYVSIFQLSPPPMMAIPELMYLWLRWGLDNLVGIKFSNIDDLNTLEKTVLHAAKNMTEELALYEVPTDDREAMRS